MPVRKPDAGKEVVLCEKCGMRCELKFNSGDPAFVCSECRAMQSRKTHSWASEEEYDAGFIDPKNLK